MTRLYYNALDALWMMERHGMTFEFGFNFKLLNDRILNYPHPKFSTLEAIRKEGSADNATGERCRFYPDAAGLALLKPKYEDGVFAFFSKEFKSFGYVKGIDDRKLGSSYVKVLVKFYGHGERKEEIFSEKRVSVIERDGKPFIMPQREE